MLALRDTWKQKREGPRVRRSETGAVTPSALRTNLFERVAERREVAEAKRDFIKY